MNLLDFEKGAFLCKPELAMAVEASHRRYGVDPSLVYVIYYALRITPPGWTWNLTYLLAFVLFISLNERPIVVAC